MKSSINKIVVQAQAIGISFDFRKAHLSENREWVMYWWHGGELDRPSSAHMKKYGQCAYGHLIGNCLQVTHGAHNLPPFINLTQKLVQRNKLAQVANAQVQKAFGPNSAGSPTLPQQLMTNILNKPGANAIKVTSFKTVGKAMVAAATQSPSQTGRTVRPSL